MQISAEMRWFWRAQQYSQALEIWFHNTGKGTCKPGGGETRLDRYLIDSGQQIGIKQRGAQPGVEVKGLIGHAPEKVVDGPFQGLVEYWCKWSTTALDIQRFRTITTSKIRWVRKFSWDGGRYEEIALKSDEKPESGELPENGCNMELTQIRIDRDDDVWWTLGFEAFGQLESVNLTLRRTLFEIAKVRGEPELPLGTFCSYPAWLQMQIEQD